MCVAFGVLLDNMDSSYNTVDLLIPASMALLTVVGNRFIYLKSRFGLNEFICFST